MLIRRLQYWSNFTVVRWQLILTALLLWTCWWFLHKNYGRDIGTEQWENIVKFLKVIQWSLIYLIGFSFCTVFSAWVFFLLRKRNKKVGLHTQFGEGKGESTETEAGLVSVLVELSGVFRPFLGTVRARLVFAGLKMSNVVLLDENVYRKKSIFRKSIRGVGKTELHDRGIYDVEEVQLQFCDMFRLIALPVTIHVSQQLYTLPQELHEKTIKAEPNTTEEQTHRIEIPKKIEGEFINYKDFETGDDVRRIVWKIYARSGQLVVRIPETKDPYASHLYFYASFFDGMNKEKDGIFETELLNCYKDKVRNLFEALQKNEYEVKIPHDQEVQKLSGMSDKKNELFHITAAHWQMDNPPTQYVNVNKAAFVCLSSLTPVGEIGHLLGNLPLNVPVVVVRMSDAIVSPFRFRFKNLFFIPEKKSIDNLRNPWLISPLRSQLVKNERAILRLLQQRGNAWVISASDKS